MTKKGIKDKKVCIIMATYNGATYLKEQLESFKKQTYKNWELFVSDDGSKDATLDILKDFQEQVGQKKVTVVKNTTKKHGALANFAFALKKAPKADYYMFSDQDDVWLPEKVERLVSAAESAPEKVKKSPLLVYSDLKIVKKDLSPLYDSMFQAQGLILPEERQLDRLLIDNYIPGCVMLFNQKLRNAVGEIPTDFHMHDWWIALVAATTGKIIKVDQPLNLYRQHADNVLGAELKDTSFLGKVKFHLGRVTKIFSRSLHNEWRERQDLRVRQAELLLKRFGQKHSDSAAVIQNFVDISTSRGAAHRIREFARFDFFPIDRKQLFKLGFRGKTAKKSVNVARSSVKKNYVYNVAYQIVALLVPLVTTPYLSRVLGAENIGIYSYTVSIVTYFVLFGTLGVNLYGAREIAYVQDKPAERSRVFWEVNLLRFITVTLSMILFCGTFGLFHEYRIYFLILSVYLFSNIFDISWFFQGMENMRAISIRSTIVRILAAVATFIFVRTPGDLWIYILIYALTFLVSNLALWIKIPSYLQKVSLHSFQIKRHVKPVFSLFLPQIASQIYVVLDKVMIGAIIADKSEVGFYEQGEKIIKMAITVITAVAVAMSPRIANSFISGKKSDLNRYMFKTFRFTFLLSLPMIVGAVVLSSRFVPVFFGEGYEKVVGIMQLLSPIILIIGFGSAIGVQYLIPTKRQKQLTISYIAGALANVALNALLIPKMGAIGACLGTIFAELSVTGVQLFFVRHEFSLPKIIKVANKYLVASVLMFGVMVVLNLFLDETIFNLVLIGVVGMFIYLVTLLTLRDELLLSVLLNFISKVKTSIKLLTKARN